MKLFFFEDHLYSNFEPLSQSRPIYTLLYGTSKLYAKWTTGLKCRDYSFLCRPYLADILKWETKKEVNTIPADDSVLINGRYIYSPDLGAAIEDLKAGGSLVCGDDLVACRIGGDRPAGLNGCLLNLHEPEALEKAKSSFKYKNVTASKVQYLWNMVSGNGDMIAEEFAGFGQSRTAPGAFARADFINPGNIYLGQGGAIAPATVIDASDGPVIIENNVIVEPLSFIQGPVYIGPGCRITGGRIREGSSFGPACRVGGEVEESIMMGYCNKYHEGFLGHAYLGEWVNLGALTTNSDLKNNYAVIKVDIGGSLVDTGEIKIGCFIGDHTKTGIGTMLNTGISIGFSSNIYGAGLFIDKRIRPFSWGTPGNMVEYRLDKAVETAGKSMSRRGIEFSAIHKKLFAEIMKLNSGDSQA